MKGNYESDIGSDILIDAINGIGLVYLIKMLVEKETAAKEIIEIPLDAECIPITIYIYYRPSPRNSIIRLFVDHIMQTVGV